MYCKNWFRKPWQSWRVHDETRAAPSERFFAAPAATGLEPGARISPHPGGDHFGSHSPKWLLVAESIARVLVFIFPLLLLIQLKDAWNKAGLAVYCLGILIYFGSWLPLLLAPDSAWSQSAAGLLAPRLTPFLPFLGIALVCNSWPYGVISAVFIFFHTWHGIQNL